MVAMARALRRLHGAELKVVFIGPCIAKKGEAASVRVAGEVDAVLTFVELREMFMHRPITPDWVQPSDFDPPRAGPGRAVPDQPRAAAGGAASTRTCVTGERGQRPTAAPNFVEAIEEFEAGDLDARLLEVLCCDGCIMGPGMSCNAPLFRRRAAVSQYVRARMATLDEAQWRGGHGAL